MTEPREIAAECEHVAEGLWHWRIHNAAIGGATSSSQAVAAGTDVVLIDPVRLAPDELAGLPAPTAVCLGRLYDKRCRSCPG